MTTPRVICKKCNSGLAKTSLRRHMKTCLNKRGPRVRCSEGCDLDFVDQKGMEIHLKTYHNNDTFPCDKCEVEPFNTKQQLINHKGAVHHLKWICKYPNCPKKGVPFSSNQNLKNHINSKHEGIRYTEIDSSTEEEKIGIEKKRRVETTDPVALFLETKKEYIKNYNREKECANLYCIVTRLAWGFPGGEKLFCSSHKEDLPGLTDLGNGHACRYMDCRKETHNKIGGFLFCKYHIQDLIEDGLPSPEENIKRPKASGKICIEPCCDKRSSCDDGQYCFQHSPSKISDDRRVCEIPDCDKKRPTFGYPGKPKTRCKKHREDGMYSHKLCREPECTICASFGQPDGLPLTCFDHRENGYVNLNATICVMACCMYGGVQAQFYHPDHLEESSEFFGKRICYFARRALIEDAIQKNDMSELNRLMGHFDLTKVTTLNAQSAFRFECEKKYHEHLGDCVDIVFDGHVHEGPKTLWSKRPDIFYKFDVDGLNYGIQIEYDEEYGHEDDPVRLKCIEENAECEGRVYLIRVNGGHGTKDPLCTEIDRKYYKYYEVTYDGKQVASRVSDAVIDRIQWIEEGLGPDDTRPYKVCF